MMVFLFMLYKLKLTRRAGASLGPFGGCDFTHSFLRKLGVEVPEKIGASPSFFV
jgi:hypothetical protein